jgi:glyoxylase-like metal-dependent hydrolase (beta-lactamase superfamily II)
MIVEALRRILASNQFASSESLRNLISYTVQKALAGEGSELKEYSIGVEALKRSTSFDPREDNIVRVQARKLRQRLADYYDSEGQDERWRPAAISRGSSRDEQERIRFWSLPETAAKLASGQLYGLGGLEDLMRASVCDNLFPVQERVRLLDKPTELASGVLVFDAHGHTPGHAAVLISSGRQQLLYAGDALIHPKQLEHPDWTSAFDLDRNETVSTRRKLLDRIVADQCLLAAFHLPGGVGVPEPFHSNFHWTAVYDPKQMQ